MTQYEMGLWRDYNLPLSEVDGSAKRYFSKGFLSGKSISGASSEDLKNAFTRLNYAVNNGCKKRCEKLVRELNEALEEKGIKPVKEIDNFLDWLTFSYFVKKDYFGKEVMEPGYGFEIRIFESDRNREEFWKELKMLLNSGRIASMQDIERIVLYRRQQSVKL